VSYTTSINNDLGYLISSGNHNTLKANLASANILGFLVDVDGNDTTLIKNRAIANRNDGPVGGFLVRGTRNTLIKNLAKDNKDSDGFRIQGTNHVVIWNKAIGNVIGIELDSGSGILVLGNTAKKSRVFGIFVSHTAHGNKLRGNIALRNGVTDLVDNNPDCDENDWKWNWFKTRNQDCIK